MEEGVKTDSVAAYKKLHVVTTQHPLIVFADWSNARATPALGPMPPPIKNFPSQYNLGGKTITPYNTNADYGIGKCLEQAMNLALRSRVVDGLSIQRFWK